MNYKLILEENLHKIDLFFKEKSQKDTYMVYIMIAGIMATLAYPFYDLSLNDYTKVQQDVDAMATKIELDNVYLKMNPEAKIGQLDSQIATLKSDVLVGKQKNEHIKSKIETISSLIYDEKAWGEYLDSIATHAKIHTMKMIRLDNKYVESNNSFGHVLDITVDVSGKYLNTIKFINALEQSQLVVDVHDLNMSARDTLDTRVNISVWGITYHDKK